MSLNSEITQLVAEVKAHAVSNAMSEKRAFGIALVRFCKQWATGQTAPKSEQAVLDDAVDKLAGRRSELGVIASGAVVVVAAAHQSEVDAIVAAGVVPE